MIRMEKKSSRHACNIFEGHIDIADIANTQGAAHLEIVYPS